MMLRHNSCYSIVMFNDNQQQKKINKINYSPLAFAIKDNKSDLLMAMVILKNPPIEARTQ